MNISPEVSRRAVEAVLKVLPAGALGLRHLDGSTTSYGKGEPYFTIVIKSPNAYARLLGNPSMSLGEAYMDGDIDIEGDIRQVPRYGTDIRNAMPGSSLLRQLRSPRENVQSRQRQQIGHHYDIGNDFFRLWLDESMMYSCAYFENADDTLEVAQANKRGLVLRKLRLERGQHVLEIGSGWGTTLIEAAERYGVTGVGVTLSQEQLAHSQALAEERGVAGQVEFRLQGYQEIKNETFDAIYSIGMYEHVGRHNGDEYFEKVKELLRDGGTSVLHTITKQSKEGGQPWINKYIFPGGYVPSSSEVVGRVIDHQFRMVHMENLRLHYAMTLEEWYRRFAEHRAEIVDMFDERFVRMWTFYLLGSAGSFRYGAQDVCQFVFTNGINNTLPLTNKYMYGISAKPEAMTLLDVDYAKAQ